MSEERPVHSHGSVLKGLGLAVLLHVLFQGVGFFALGGLNSRNDYLWFVQLAFIGASQWLYLGPCLGILHSKRAKETMKGVWIVGGVTMLLNGACWGVAMTGGI